MSFYIFLAVAALYAVYGVRMRRFLKSAFFLYRSDWRGWGKVYTGDPLAKSLWADKEYPGRFPRVKKSMNLYLFRPAAIFSCFILVVLLMPLEGIFRDVRVFSEKRKSRLVC